MLNICQNEFEELLASSVPRSFCAELVFVRTVSSPNQDLTEEEKTNCDMEEQAGGITCQAASADIFVENCAANQAHLIQQKKHRMCANMKSGTDPQTSVAAFLRSAVAYGRDLLQGGAPT